MATVWPSKTPTEKRAYTWEPPVPLGDGISTATATVDSGTVTAVLVTDNDRHTDFAEVVFDISGGAADEIAQITLAATTTEGRTYEESFILPVRDGVSSYSKTGAQICAFALRKVVGIGRASTAAEQSTALEILNTMIATWRGEGIDLGLTSEVTATTTLNVPEEAIPALQYNLMVLAGEEFSRPITPTISTAAEATKNALRNTLMVVEDMDFERPLLRRRSSVVWEGI